MKHYLEALAYLAAAYPNWNFPAETAQTWATELAVLPHGAVQAACKALCVESKFPPTLADIFTRAKILASPAPSGMTHGEAWAELMRNRVIFSQNRYESRDERRKPYAWTCEAARQAAEQIGWTQDWEGESMNTTRAQFRDIFNGIVERQARIDWRTDALQHAEDVRRIEAQQKQLEQR